MKKIVILNWKNSLLVDEQISLLDDIEHFFHRIDYVNLIILPSLDALGEIKTAPRRIAIGTQEVIREMADNESVYSRYITYAMVGHPDSLNKGLTERELAQQLGIISASKMTPILIVSDSGQDDSFREVRQQLEILKFWGNREIIIAYEPLDSIGTGDTTSMEHITKAMNCLSKVLAEYGINKYNLVYGGSVNHTNIREITDINYVDGVIVGTASRSITTVSSLLYAIL